MVRNHKRCTLKIRESPGTFAGTFSGPLINCKGKVSTKNKPHGYFIPNPRKESKNRSSRFKPKVSLISFRGFESIHKLGVQTKRKKERKPPLLRTTLMRSQLLRRVSGVAGLQTNKQTKKHKEDARQSMNCFYLLTSRPEGKVEFFSKRTCAFSLQWNPVYKAFHRIRCCETKQFVNSNSNVISARQTCDQRSGMAAASKHQGLAFYFPVRIC